MATAATTGAAAAAVMSSSLFCLLIIFSFNVQLRSCQNTLEKLEKIDYECTRQCDSHFSGVKCWETTLKFFSNDLIQSIILYKNAIKLAKYDSNALDAVILKYMDYMKENDNLNAFYSTSPFNVTLSLLDKIMSLPPSSSPQLDYVSECPKDCQPSDFTVWQSLFGVFIGLTVATIIFLVGYIAFLKLQYQKFDKNLTSNSINS